MGSDTEDHADLMKFIGDEATASILNALCGPYLLSLSPSFLQDFWDFDRNLQTYLQGTHGHWKHTAAYLISLTSLNRNPMVSRPEGLRSS